MGRRRRLRWAAAAVALLGLGVVASAAGVKSKKPAPGKTFKAIFPPDHSVLLSGSFDLIVTGGKGDLVVNGKPQKLDPFRPPLQVAHLHLSAGMNELKIGDRQLQVFVARYPGDEDAPAGWPTYKPHQIDEVDAAKRCTDCHEQKKQDGQIVVGPWKGYESCLECHDPVEFGAIHAHPLEPLEPCIMCHAIHGSTQKKLLKAPAKKLCAACHDS